MARITIELNTSEDANDIVVLRAVAGAYDTVGETDAASEAYRASVEVARPTPAAPTAEPAKRGRPKKSEASAPPVAASSDPSTLFAQTSTTTAPPNLSMESGPVSADTPITLQQVNDKIRACITASVPAAKLGEVIKQATDGRHGSATGMMNDTSLDDTTKQGYLEAIMAGLEIL